MSAAELQDRRFTEEEYLQLCLHSDHKYEYHGGLVTMMAGGKRAHNLAKRNFYADLIKKVTDCTVYDSDVAVHIKKADRYFFPDISGLCGPEDVSDEPGIERVMNPQVLIEVLSKSTAKFDLGEKFTIYKQLDSFKEYIVVDSREHFVWTYYREETGLWRIANYYRLDQEVKVITFGVSIPMATIYEGVDIEED